MVAQRLSLSQNGNTVVATVIAQWTLLIGQRRHNVGTREADASLRLKDNVYNKTHYFMGRPLADHCASILWPRRCVRLPRASFERPASNQPPRWPLCDCFEHCQHFMAIMAYMTTSDRPVYHLWITEVTIRPPLWLQRRPNQFYGRTREAKGRTPSAKVVLRKNYRTELW